jgi:hypothetical protein
MPKINWIDKLNDEQAIYAAKIIEKAQAAGVPPELAVALAYHESGLDPQRIGQAKEIGLMQILPSTGKMMGYSPGELHDPDKNIEAGLKYLKQQLDTFGNAPEIAALAYNRGPGVANEFIAGKPDEAGEKYVRSVQGLGGFSRQVQVEEPTRPEIAQPTDVSQDEDRQKELYGIAGAGTGAAISAGRLVGEQAKKAVGSAAQFIGQQMEQGRMAAQGLSAAGAAPAGGLPGGQTSPASARPPLYTEPQVKRLLGGTTDEMGTTGRARMESFNARTAQEAAGRRALSQQAPKLVQQGVWAQTPEQFFAAQPMQVASPGGILLPADAAQRIAAEAAAKAAKPTGALEQVSQMFRTMMGKGANVLSKFAAPLALFGAAKEGLEAERELRSEQPSPASLGLSALGALGGGMSLFPPTAIPGAALAMGAPYAREEIKKIQQRAVTPEVLGQITAGRQPMDMSRMMQGLGATQTLP